VALSIFMSFFFCLFFVLYIPYANQRNKDERIGAIFVSLLPKEYDKSSGIVLSGRIDDLYKCQHVPVWAGAGSERIVLLFFARVRHMSSQKAIVHLKQFTWGNNAE